MDLRNILVISGKPGLYELISHTKTGAIVESLTDKRRVPVFQNDRISSLGEISIFTETSDKPLKEVLQSIYSKENGAPIDVSALQKDSKLLFGYFKDVLPDYDTTRVYASDVKKVLSWYNLLIGVGKIDLEDNEPKEESTKE